MPSVGGGSPSSRRLPSADRKSTRLNSSHSQISYAVFCLKKKKKIQNVSSNKLPKRVQLKFLTTYIPKRSAFTLPVIVSQLLRPHRTNSRTFLTSKHLIIP